MKYNNYSIHFMSFWGRILNPSVSNLKIVTLNLVTVRLCQDFSSVDSRRENCLIVYLGILADTYRRRFGEIEAHRNDRLRYLP